ncbi:ATP-binding protein [Novosphingobium rosa]|uniref:ATP-binding protein n=1 Tax=Novosphingobium rosa TaxID=76978 RepID=UPI0008312802|nr:ATP-binding protein [Novosphingobium rosa]
MSDQLTAQIERVIAALERIAAPTASPIDWSAAPAYVWNGIQPRAVATIEAASLDLIYGVDEQKAKVVDNVLRHAHGHAAHDMLLWGSRGMGKSALLRASLRHAREDHGTDLALVQVAPDALSSLTTLFSVLRDVNRPFLVFIDDLGFEEGDTAGPRALRSWLEGGVEARPRNVRLAVTANRRAIVSRHMSEQDDPINPRDAVDDQLALADRFGLSIGFHNCSQDDYLGIIRGYAAAYGLEWEVSDALEWSKRRGGRSGRIASHYITELAGRVGKQI